MSLEKKKIGILIETDFYYKEISYYQLRFEEQGIEVEFLTRLWDAPSQTYCDHDYRTIPLPVNKSFENMSDDELKTYSAIIVPSGMVADRLRYTEDVKKLSPACEFLKRVFAEKSVLKGIICHGLWLVSPIAEVIKGRKVTVSNNLISDAKNMGAEYMDENLVVDNDLVTARTGDHCNIFATKIIEILNN